MEKKGLQVYSEAQTEQNMHLGGVAEMYMAKDFNLILIAQKQWWKIK